MKKTIFIFAFAFLLGTAFLVNAHSDEDFSAAQNLIQQKVSCSELNDTQLAEIGDYYMEQIHPGSAHEAMDAMMGGEGSQSLEQMHIAMAYSYYCNENQTGKNYGYGMMSGYGWGGMGYYNYQNPFNWFNVLLIVAIVVLAVWLAMEIRKNKRHGRKK